MTTPRNYQIEGVEQLERWDGRGLLGDDMGLGKSFQSLLYAQRNPKEADRIVVVCPASLKWNWQREAAKHVDMRGTVLDGTKPPERGFRNVSDPLLIVNYDVLGRRNSLKSGPGWLGYLKRFDPTLVIIDECHYLAGRDSLRTKSVRELCEDIPHVLALSGTPLLSKPADLWPTLNILSPRTKILKSFFTFAWRYCRPRKDFAGKWEFKGAANLDELHDRLKKKLMIRRRKVDVLDELPPKTRTVVPLDMNKWREYLQAQREARDALRYARQSREQAADYLQAANALRLLTAELKVPAVIQWVKDFLAESDEKLLLFGVHREKFLHPIYEAFKGLSVLVTGSVVGSKRQAAFDQFNHDKRCRLFLANIVAGGCGWSCTSATNVAFGELSWHPGNHVQAEDRCWGLARGQGSKPLFCHYLVGRGTVEEGHCELIQNRQAVLDNVLDGLDDESTLSIYDEYINLIRGTAA